MITHIVANGLLTSLRLSNLELRRYFKGVNSHNSTAKFTELGKFKREG